MISLEYFTERELIILHNIVTGTARVAHIQADRELCGELTEIQRKLTPDTTRNADPLTKD